MSELLTVSEVARILRVDDSSVRRWIKRGTLEAFQLPHAGERAAYRIKRETLDTIFNAIVIPGQQQQETSAKKLAS